MVLKRWREDRKRLTQQRKQNDGSPQSLLDVRPLRVGAEVRGSLGLGQHDADDVDQEEQVDLECEAKVC